MTNKSRATPKIDALSKKKHTGKGEFQDTRIWKLARRLERENFALSEKVDTLNNLIKKGLSPCVEVWRGERKVTVYPGDIVLRSWGDNINYAMSDEPATLQAVQNAMDWLYNDIPNNQIKYMVQRFLGWRLPENFKPDAGISFKADFNEGTPWPMKHNPIGTNLLDADQAEAMIRYLVDGMQQNLEAQIGTTR